MALKYYLPYEEKNCQARELICTTLKRPFEAVDYGDLAEFASDAFTFEMTENYIETEFRFPNKIAVIDGDQECQFDVEREYEPSYWVTKAL